MKWKKRNKENKFNGILNRIRVLSKSYHGVCCRLEGAGKVSKSLSEADVSQLFRKSDDELRDFIETVSGLIEESEQRMCNSNITLIESEFNALDHRAVQSIVREAARGVIYTHGTVTKSPLATSTIVDFDSAGVLARVRNALA